MALKDTWEDLQNAVAGVPDSGSEITVQPINDIAHAVIDLEENEDVVTNIAPYIGDNGNWYVYDVQTKTYIDSGMPSRGEQGLQGEKGEKGEQGVQGEKGDPYILTKTDKDEIVDTVIEDITPTLEKKVDKTTILEDSIIEVVVIEGLETNTENVYGELSSLSVSFPENISLEYISSIVFSTPAELQENYSTFPSEVYFKGDECDEGIFIPNFSTRYTILFYYDGVKIIGLVSGIEIEVVISE